MQDNFSKMQNYMLNFDINFMNFYPQELFKQAFIDFSYQ